MQITNSTIHYYLTRYFDGETTCAEEAAIVRYFKEEKHLPDNLQDYKAMFVWIDAGMPEGTMRTEKKHYRGTIWSSAIWWLSSAAVLALIITVASGLRHNVPEMSPEEHYRGSYVQKNGVITDNIVAIMPDIKSTLKQVDDMEKELDNLNFDNPDFII